MTRTYTLKRRAEQQAETRQRIVEATVDLHSSVGPAQTTISMIAERAGVQRHTVYAHFPDERSLFAACSGCVAERDPLPEAGAWRAIEDRGERLRIGLTAIYGWYQRNAAVVGCVLRDAEVHEVTRETAASQFGPVMAAWHAVLGERLSPAQQPLLTLAFSFFTWRSLTRDSGLREAAAVDTMVRAVLAAD